VRREGVFITGAAKHVNLPDDIAGAFVEPIAEVWGRSIIQEIRKRTREFASDCERMVTELADWCRGQGAGVSPTLLNAQLQALRTDIKQIDIAGKEVIDSLRDDVRKSLPVAIHKPIKAKCNAFVKKGDDAGRGVRDRMLELFDGLSDDAAGTASESAKALLLRCFKTVEIELQDVRKDIENPLDNAAETILQAHRLKVEKADRKKRSAVVADCDRVISSAPVALREHLHAEATA
jgi:hypothetical protein